MALIVIAFGVGALLAIEIPNMRAIRRYSSVPLGASEDAIRELLGAPSRVLAADEGDAELRRFGVQANGAQGETLVYQWDLVWDPAYIVLDKAGVVRRVVVINGDTGNPLDDRAEEAATP